VCELARLLFCRHNQFANLGGKFLPDITGKARSPWVLDVQLDAIEGENASDRLLREAELAGVSVPDASLAGMCLPIPHDSNWPKA